MSNENGVGELTVSPAEGCEQTIPSYADSRHCGLSLLCNLDKAND